MEASLIRVLLKSGISSLSYIASLGAKIAEFLYILPGKILRYAQLLKVF